MTNDLHLIGVLIAISQTHRFLCKNVTVMEKEIKLILFMETINSFLGDIKEQNTGYDKGCFGP